MIQCQYYLKKDKGRSMEEKGGKGKYWIEW